MRAGPVDEVLTQAPADTSHDVPAGAWSVLAVVFASTVVISLSSTMLTIALPSMAADLDASAGQTSWALTAYLLTNTASTLLMGQVADAVDRRAMFLGGIAVFTVTSVLLAYVDSVGSLVALRAAQGLGGAMLLCNAVAVLVAVFPGRLLSRAMGVYLAGFSIAQVVGPTVGGLMTAWFGWRSLFWCCVPVGVLALVWGWRALGRVPLPRSSRLRIDGPGNLTAAAILVAALGALTLAPDRGWQDPWVLGALTCAVAGLPVLGALERRASHPAVDVALFRDRAFAGAVLAGFLVSSPRLSLMVAAALWFQGIEGQTPLEAAGHVTGAAVGLTVGALVAEPLTRLASELRVALLAAAGSILGLVLLAWAVGSGGGAALQVGLVVVGLGTGVFHPLNVSAVMRTVPVARAGSVNALRVTLQSTSLALGSATTIALVVAWADPGAAGAFVAGDPAALTAADVEDIVGGYRVLFGSFAALVVLGAAAAVAGRRASRAQAAVER